MPAKSPGSKPPKAKAPRKSTTGGGKGDVKPQGTGGGKRGHPEHDAQVALFKWSVLASGRYPELRLMYAVPNFAHLTPRAGAWLKAEGKKAGVPDICLPVARGEWHALYIEMKAPEGRHGPEQVEWLAALREAGNCTMTRYSSEQARSALLWYLAL